MSNQPATFLAFRKSFTTTKINAQELNSAIIAIETELYKMKTDKVLLNQELALLRTKLPETMVEKLFNESIEEILSKIIEIIFTTFSTIITSIITVGATTKQLDFLQAIDITGKIIVVVIIVLSIFIAVQKIVATFLKPITMVFDNTFRQPLICTVSYMLTHQDEMKNIDENELLALLQKNIAKTE